MWRRSASLADGRPGRSGRSDDGGRSDRSARSANRDDGGRPDERPGCRANRRGRGDANGGGSHVVEHVSSGGR